MKEDKTREKIPSVSVIIPTCKRIRELKRAIESVLNQTFQDFEVVVVDDNNLGETKDQVKKIVEDFCDKRLRYISHEKNKGNAIARNTGIKLARGKYIAFLDDDDIFLPKKLEKHVKILDKSSEDVVLTYAQHLGVDRINNYKVASPLEKDAKSGYIYDYMLKRYFKKGILFQVWDAVIKRKYIENMKFDEGGVDDFLLRLAKRGKFIFIPEILHIQNLDAEGRISTTSIRSLPPIIESDIIYKKHFDYIKKRGIKYDRQARISRCFLTRGTRLIRRGKINDGRKHILYSIKLKPSLYALFVLISSFFGKSFFVKILKLRQKMIGGLE